MNKDKYNSALQRIEQLMNKQNTAKEKEELIALAKDVEKYEKRIQM